MPGREKRTGVEIPELPKLADDTESQTPLDSSATLSEEAQKTAFPPSAETKKEVVEEAFFDFVEKAEKPEEIGEEIRDFVGIFDDQDFGEFVYLANSSLNDLAKKEYYTTDPKKCLIMGKLTKKMLIYYSFRIKLIHVFIGTVFFMYVIPTIKLVWDWIVSLKEKKEKEEEKDVAHIDGGKEETNPRSA